MGRLKRRLPSFTLLAWLTGVAVLLWGEFSWANLATGLVLALLITIASPIPRVPRRGRLRPLAVVVLVVRFLVDVVTSAIHVAMVAVRREPPDSAVIEVRLRSHSDLILATTAGLTTLIPGSVVIEANRFTGVLYLHVLDVSPVYPDADIDKARGKVLRQEERVLRAIASDAELADAGYAPGWCSGKG